MEKNHFSISLARQDFRIVCSETPEHMKALESSVNARIESIRKKYPSMSTLRIVLLAMLDMEDDLFKARLEGAERSEAVGKNSSKADEEDDF